MIESEETRAFAEMFANARKGSFVDRERLETRRKAERRAAMSEKQLSRGGRARSAQMNVRTTPAIKALAAKIANELGIGLAETIELAISELASQKGVKPDA